MVDGMIKMIQLPSGNQVMSASVDTRIVKGLILILPFFLAVALSQALELEELKNKADAGPTMSRITLTNKSRETQAALHLSHPLRSSLLAPRRSLTATTTPSFAPRLVAQLTTAHCPDTLGCNDQSQSTPNDSDPRQEAKNILA